MKENTLRIIIIGIALITIITGAELKSGEIEYVPCYDQKGNLILETNCEKKILHPISPYIVILGMIIGMIGLFIKK